MADKLGQEFTGKVSGANDFGVYVELDDSKCEGSVPLRTLLDDHYSYDEKTLSVVGRRSHRRLSIGDPVKIRVVSANLERRQLEFAMVEVNGHAVAY